MKLQRYSGSTTVQYSNSFCVHTGMWECKAGLLACISMKSITLYNLSFVWLAFVLADSQRFKYNYPLI